MDELIEEINKLIADEEEAIDGYNQAIEIFDGYPQVIERLEEIRGDEEEHIQELEQLKAMLLLKVAK